MICDVCKSDYLTEICIDPTRPEKWFRCLDCGSDTSTSDYEQVKYNYINTTHPGLSLTDAIQEMRANLDWFDHYQPPNKDFLDIGFLEGASLVGMTEKGFSVHGFEINKKCYLGPHTTIGEEFLASLFPRQYGAIMCREVIEHVPNWVKLLNEAYKALVPDGIFQVQTPRPATFFHENIYQYFHLRIFSPYTFKTELQKAGFEILEYRQWDRTQPGQAAICRKITNTV